MFYGGGAFGCQRATVMHRRVRSWWELQTQSIQRNFIDGASATMARVLTKTEVHTCVSAGRVWAGDGDR